MVALANWLAILWSTNRSSLLNTFRGLRWTFESWAVILAPSCFQCLIGWETWRRIFVFNRTPCQWIESTWQRSRIGWIRFCLNCRRSAVIFWIRYLRRDWEAPVDFWGEIDSPIMTSSINVIKLVDSIHVISEHTFWEKWLTLCIGCCDILFPGVSTDDFDWPQSIFLGFSLGRKFLNSPVLHRSFGDDS
jgi:hypothetical protein